MFVGQPQQGLAHPAGGAMDQYANGALRIGH
jgi:hypothetical protein